MITANIPHTTFKYPVGEMQVKLDLTSPYEEQEGLLQVIFENGLVGPTQTLQEIRERLAR